MDGVVKFSEEFVKRYLEYKRVKAAIDEDPTLLDDLNEEQRALWLREGDLFTEYEAILAQSEAIDVIYPDENGEMSRMKVK